MTILVFFSLSSAKGGFSNAAFTDPYELPPYGQPQQYGMEPAPQQYGVGTPAQLLGANPALYVTAQPQYGATGQYGGQYAPLPSVVHQPYGGPCLIVSVCLCVWGEVWSVCVGGWVDVCVCWCVCVCMCVCVGVLVCVERGGRGEGWWMCVCVLMCVLMCVCECVYAHACVGR